MKRALRMSDEVRDALRQAAERAAPEEMVGLLFGESREAGEVRELRLLPNRSRWPQQAFEADPGEVVRALVDASRRSLELLALVHSHPGSSSTALSPRDLDGAFLDGEAAWPGVMWVVVAPEVSGAEAMRAWAVDGGGIVEAEISSLR